MHIDKMVDIEERELDKRLEEGEITSEEHSRQVNNLHREARGAIEEEAQRAYDDVMNSY